MSTSNFYTQKHNIRHYYSMRELRQLQHSHIMMNTTRLVILRHGESEFNRLNLFCGWHDSPLSSSGVQQARCIAAKTLLSEQMEFDVVYTSVLCRARHTADIILGEMNCSFLPVKEDWRLSERHYGDLTGYNKPQMVKIFGAEKVQSWRRSYDEVPPNITKANPYYYSICDNPAFNDVPVDQFPFAESMHMCTDRVATAWEEIKLEMLKGTRILIICHGTVARALIKLIEGLSDQQISKVNVPNSVPCVYEFDLKTGQRIGNITYLGDPNYIKRKMEEVASIGPETQ